MAAWKNTPAPVRGVVGRAGSVSAFELRRWPPSEAAGRFVEHFDREHVAGLGLLGFKSVVDRDYPVVFATAYIFGLMGLLVTLLSDLTYVWVDPRIDFETRET